MIETHIILGYRPNPSNVRLARRANTSKNYALALGTQHWARVAGFWEMASDTMGTVKRDRREKACVCVCVCVCVILVWDWKGEAVGIRMCAWMLRPACGFFFSPLNLGGNYFARISFGSLVSFLSLSPLSPLKGLVWLWILTDDCVFRFASWVRGGEAGGGGWG